MQSLSLWFGHGDDDPHGIELNDGLGLHVLSLDMGQPDEATDRRDITVTVLARGATVAAASRRVQQLSRLVTRAAQRHAGTVAPATLRISGASLETTWWDVLQVTTAMGAEGVDSTLRSGYATVEITFTTRAYGRGAPVTLVEGAIVDQANPVLVLPPVDTDAPAELEVDLDDLTTGGTGVNRWRVAAMPLSPDADVPTLTVPFARHEPVALTASGATATGSGAVTIAGSARVQAPLRGLSPVEGWVAMRLRPAWASTGDPLSGAHPYAWAWADSGTRYLLLRYRVDLDRWEFGRAGATVGLVRAPATPFAAGDGLTLVARWSATEIALSLNGGPFVVSSHSDAPALAATLYDIGSFGDLVADSRLTGDVHWFAAGTGGISEAEAAALAGLGDTDPGWSLLPAGTVLRWTADSATEAEAPVWGHGTLEGGVPPSATVRQDWQTIAEGDITWPEDAPPPQAALLLARVADSEPVGAPIERLSVREADGPLAFQRVEADGNTVTFPAVPANSMLVAAARAKTTGAFTWPAGWTVQATAAANGWRAELATCPVATETETASVTVTAGGAQLALVGYAVPGATGVAGAVSLNAAGSVTLPGSAAYHATIAMGFAEFAGPASPFAAENVTTGQLVLSSVTTSHGLVPSTSEPIAEMANRGDVAHYAGIGTGAPGSLRYRPVTVTKFTSTSETRRNPLTGEEEPLTVTVSTPARTALLVAVVLTTTQTAPAVTAGTYRVGVTGLMADGRETPLLLTETVRTRGLRPIAAAWQPALAAAAGMAYWRVYYQLQGQAWRYIQVDADVYAATITSTAAGTLGAPPQAVALTGAEIRAVVSAAPGAARTRELPPAGCRAGMGRWEVVPVGVVPLPLVPGGPARLHVAIRARTAIGARRVWLDRVLLLPVHQELGGLVAELRDRARSVPMRWRHRIDPAGRTSMRLWGTIGDAQAPDGIQLDPLGTEDVELPEWTAPRMRVAPPGSTVTNLLPGHALSLDGPHWMGSLAANGQANPVYRPGLPYEDAGEDAYPGGGDSYVLRAKATGTISPAMGVTAGTTYTGSAYVRVPPGGSAATVRLRLVWYQADGITPVGQVDGAAVTTTDGWQVLTVTGQAPAGAVVARLHLVWVSGTADVWLDAVQFETGTTRTVYQHRETLGPNLFVNTTFDVGSYGWQLLGGARWRSDLLYVEFFGSGLRGMISDPLRVRPGTTYTVSVDLGGTPTYNIVFHWYDLAGNRTSDVESVPSTGRRSLTRTAPPTAASLQIEVSTSVGTGGNADNIRITEGTDTTFAADVHTATSPVAVGGPLDLLHHSALTDVAAARGWLVIRFSSFTTAPSTVWQWRSDDANQLRLELTATEVRLVRVTSGTSHTVSVPRPQNYYPELIAYAIWTETELTLRLHDGTAWGAPATAASTAWPDLSGAGWHLGSRLHDDGSEDQYLWGRLVWAALGTEPDGFDPTSIPAFVGEEPIPDDIPDAAGLAWLWMSTNPGRMVVWREGGYATVSGTVRAYDGPTALVVIGETAGWEHWPSLARVTVRAVPRAMYLRGA